MTGAELVSEAISYYDNTLANDATNAARRLRVLHNAQLVLDEIYNYKNWPFKHHTFTGQAASGELELPNYPHGAPTPPSTYDGISFGRLGPEGYVRDADTGAGWTETTLQEIMAIRSHNFQSMLKVFALGSVSGPDGGYKLIIPNTALVGPNLEVFFDSAPPVLLDSSAEITAIPYQYQRTVLLAGTVVRMQTSKSDVRKFWEAQYQNGLGRMAVNEMPLQSRVAQLPLFQRGQW